MSHQVTVARTSSVIVPRRTVAPIPERPLFRVDFSDASTSSTGVFPCVALFEFPAFGLVVPEGQSEWALTPFQTHRLLWAPCQ